MWDFDVSWFFFLLVLCFHRLLPLCEFDRTVGAELRDVLCNLWKREFLLPQRAALPIQQHSGPHWILFGLAQKIDFTLYFIFYDFFLASAICHTHYNFFMPFADFMFSSPLSYILYSMSLIDGALRLSPHPSSRGWCFLLVLFRRRADQSPVWLHCQGHHPQQDPPWPATCPARWTHTHRHAHTHACKLFKINTYTICLQI